ncbi:hypothetical protein BCR32DRAFT_266866 [Anaeromyces robustus]|uniref:Uncharacterized protein n=1 Tax=Anaeromyces robustus TaxID=1754192 RepID=A0A1Y1XCX5_9FUNG|nr:hypothetical protein BCR32DRAFT_266866 [Anaeromyces robustus]|eukprot:ORX83567.1 hypothetical protein BCR32DRAFT_266866 [Anaeromyces robustus]
MFTALITSLIVCIIEFLVIIIASPLAKPKLVLKFLPEDIRIKGSKHPEPPLYKQMIAHFLLSIFLISYLGAIIFLGKDGLNKKNYGFWNFFFRYMIFFYFNKFYDIIVQDQWLVMSTNFFKNIYPETIQCKGWKDRKFNNKNQIKRIIIFPFICLLISGICVIL